MEIHELRANVHQLVDEIENEQILDQFYAALQMVRRKQSSGDFWDAFTDEQRRILDQALRETDLEENWVSHDQVKQDAEKWLRE